MVVAGNGIEEEQQDEVEATLAHVTQGVCTRVDVFPGYVHGCFACTM